MRDSVFNLRRSEAGFSIIEVLIAGALIAFIAVAILPSMFSVMDASKTTSFKVQCSAIVRAKLQEYVNGVATTGDVSVPSGFEYTKKRYQDQQSSCQTDPSPSSPGFREAVGTNTVLADNAAPESYSALSQKMQGFRLFVMIRHYNPRTLSTGNQPTRACPSANYQFFRTGDALEVTVTGMIRVRPPIAESGRGNAKWGNLDDITAGGAGVEDDLPNPLLTCTVSQVIYPPNIPFRYYLGLDGKLRSYLAQIAFTSTAAGSTDYRQAAMEAHFRSLWSTVPTGGSTTSPVVGNLKNVVIAPDNLSAYVLKSGLISQYRSCSNSAVSVTTAGGTTYSFPGTPDCSTSSAAGSRKEWPTNPNIEAIAVDFKSLTNLDDDVIYGLFNSGASQEGVTGKGLLQKGTYPLPAAGIEIAWADSNPATDGISNIPFLPRIRGIFLGQTFPALANNATPNLYIIDNTCYAPGSSTDQRSWVYCVSIFNAADTSANLDVGNLPVQVQSVSY